MTIKFYSFPMSSGSRVHWALEELALPYEHVVLDRANDEHRKPAYLAINPNGKVPALIDDGQTLFESLAILIFLGEKYGVDANLWPAGPQRAEALSWTVWSTTELGLFGFQYAYHGLDTPISYAKAQRSQAAADYNLHMFRRALDVLETRLGGREYMLDGFSLVDIPSVLTLWLFARIGVPLEGYSNIAGWLERCTKRPAFSRVD